ncbi:DEAD/DEAH box helicase [Corynebacterium flavescens]|uniref:DEAD/DEAH box helicase n=1 Tax=Corynebacterium flavescens TaxID=28028 RepID=UPI003FD2D3BF
MSSLIPTRASRHIADGLSEYVTTSFSLAEDLTSQQLRAFLQAPHGGMFFGPYVKTRLPYAPAQDWKGILGWLPQGFTPYRHQAQAFERLASYSSAEGTPRRPQPTLVVTGTGSGKTESFLYPILDHCRSNRGSGIKALILYPMNALAADQEKRLTRLLMEDEALAGITAGLYTGEVASGGRRKVSERGLITDREVMRDTPPDILLTNYKMLDQLLLRAADRPMWEKSAATLQYLVLDEFHTYDAAQGSDVAMLLRRLGLMLKKYQGEGVLDAEEAARPLGKITPVATSATLGGGGSADAAGDGSAAVGGVSGAHADMLNFAHTVFGEKLEPEAVVGETLLDVKQWRATIPELVGLPVVSTPLPTVETMEAVIAQVASVVEGIGLAEAAFGEPADSAESAGSSGVTEKREYDMAVHFALCDHLLLCCETVEEAIAAMAGNALVEKILRAATQPLPLEHAETRAGGEGTAARIAPLVEEVFDASILRAHREMAVEFLTIVLSEIAYLRAQFGALRGWDGKKIPGVETHLWVREISRIDRAVGQIEDSEAVAGDEEGLSEQSIFRWSDDGGIARGVEHAHAGADTGRAWLPAIYCRHCGRSGWMLAVQPGGDTFETAPQKIRALSLTHLERLRPLIDATSEAVQGVLRSDDDKSRVKWLNMDLPGLMEAEPAAEVREESPVVPVLVYSGEGTEERAKAQNCPSCGEDDAIRYLGSSVATLLSVALSNLFGMDELDNAEKKTLVFADSVQDAAHRAGFVQNRARAFAVRSRIWRAVESYLHPATDEGTEALSEGVNGVRLDLLSARMVEHAQAEPTPAESARALFELLPPELKDSARFRAVWEKGSTPSEVTRALTQLRKRLDLDLALQFGDRVDLPRSLVSTGTLSVAVDVEDEVLLKAAQSVGGVLATDAELLGWARGCVEYMRISGGIYHDWFKGFLGQDCNRYLLNSREARAKGVPGFVRGGEPKFPRAGAALKGALGKRGNSAAMSLSAQQGWYARWTNKALGTSVGSAFDAAKHATELFAQLEYAGVVDSLPTASGGRIYSLPPSHIVVREESTPQLLECPVCHLRAGVDADGRAALTGTACFTLSCSGSFEVIDVEDNYYQRLYRTRNTRTVVSAEHTSLVPTNKRKEIEDQFKLPAEQQQADAPNVLVATPTLEMGIDIGDLSTVMLASMPSTVASYVQRVGRAGRLSGNSLIVALVRGRGPALTKLEHPLETIAGSVTAPAAYLSARDIMHRQFLAYLIDELEPSASSARYARDVLSRNSESLLDEIAAMAEQAHSLQAEAEAIATGKSEEVPSAKDVHICGALGRFSATLRSNTAPEVLQELARWVTSPGGMVADIDSARTRWSETNIELLKRLEVMEQRKNELEERRAAAAIEDDDTKNQLDSTQAALRFTRKQLKDHAEEYWISALERYGLLPNFTLLDDSVEFHLSVSSFNVEVQKFETKVFDYSRGISSALTELAPGNTFYVQGVGAEVDSVELGAEHSAITQWRLCPECSYCQPTGVVLSAAAQSPVSAPPAGPCPACGAPGFADREQLVDVVEMSKVYASVDSARSAISDNRDDRATKRFQTQLSYRVPEGGHGKAWYLSDSGFGMEYLPHVDMRWLNLGCFGGGAKRVFAAAEREAPLFRVCEHCGHLDSQAGANRWQDHAPWCKHRNSVEEESLTIALGRTLGTQAVLVHLPALLGMLDSSTLPSLIAAFKLGFKEYLGGNPDHLDVEQVRAPSDGFVSDMLLVHDTIPGGTGYLAQFTDPAHVRRLFEVAYRRLVSCHCAHEDRECCPSCLLPFARSSQLPQTSRAAAVVALGKILADDIHLSAEAEPLEYSWEGHLTEHKPEGSAQSQLERRFLDQLRQDLKAMGAVVSDAVVGNYAHWTIDFGPQVPHKWTMKEQVNLGFTIPDIVFSTPDPQVRDIALYLDGAAYHASSVHNRVADDFEKRNRLYADGYLPWSLTWHDIDNRQARVNGEYIEPACWVEPSKHAVFSRQFNIAAERMDLLGVDGLSLLEEVLLDPGKEWQDLSHAAVLEAVLGGEGTGQEYWNTYGKAVEVRYSTRLRQLVFENSRAGDEKKDWQLFVGLSNYFYLDPSNAVVRVIDSDVETNLEDSATASGVAVGVDAMGIEAQPAAEPDSAASSTPPIPLEWEEILAEFQDEPEARDCLRVLAQAGIAPPDESSLGTEVDGAPIIARWPEEKLVLLYADDVPDLGPGLEAGGMHVFGADFSEVPAEVAALFY